MLGYADRTKGYRILTSTNPVQIVETMHVTFAEELVSSPAPIRSLPDTDGTYFLDEPPAGQHSSFDDDFTSEHILEPPVDDLTLPGDGGTDDDSSPSANVTAEDHPPARASPYPPRQHRPPARYTTTNRVFAAKASTTILPTKIYFKDAPQDPMLRTSMTTAIEELYELNAIEIVALQPTDRPIKARWVHQPKVDASGKLLRMKSRVCPQGFRFRPNIDFNPDEVSSAAPSIQTLMLGLNFEVQRRMTTIHVDAVNCFQAESNLPADSRILLQTPDGFYVPPGHAIRMINALQGSPQAGRIWQDKVDIFLRDSLHFNSSTIDPCFYWKWSGECFTFIVRSTDDFRVSSDKPAECQRIVNALMGEWKMTIQIDKSWNGMVINHAKSKDTLTISMKRDISEMLDEFGMASCAPVWTPADPNTKLKAPTALDHVASAFPYRRAVGQLLWFARTGRPDILYAVNQLTQFAHDWDSSHVQAAKKVMRYLKGSIDLVLTLHRTDDPELIVYADADFAAEPEGNDFPMCSTSGMVAFMRGVGAIYSSVNLEKTISHSTAEAEYKSISRAAKFTEGLRQFLDEIGFPQTKATALLNDNQAAIAMSKQIFCSSSTRHMKIKFHYIRQLIKDGTVDVNYTPTGDMVADMMTKALPRVPFEKFRSMLLDGTDPQGNSI